MRERLAKNLGINVNELNKGHIYYTNILSTYFHEEISRVLQQYIAARGFTPYSVLKIVEASARRILSDDLLKEHDKIARKRLDIVLAKLETYTPTSSEIEDHEKKKEN